MDLNIEELIPHRGRMKLLDEIIEVTKDTAITASKVTEQWPLFEQGSVSTIVLIELVAQTAGVCLGLRELKKRGKSSEGKGWLVGIKDAVFFCDRIPCTSRIITDSTNIFDFENYHEVMGISRVEDAVIGKVSLQVVQSG